MPESFAPRSFFPDIAISKTLVMNATILNSAPNASIPAKESFEHSREEIEIKLIIK